MSQFPKELCKLEPSNLVYAWRMSACMVELKVGFVAHILSFFICFSLSPLKIFVIVFPGRIKARTLKLGTHIWSMSYCIVGLIRSSLLLFSPHFSFIYFSVFLR